MYYRTTPTSHYHYYYYYYSTTIYTSVRLLQCTLITIVYTILYTTTATAAAVCSMYSPDMVMIKLSLTKYQHQED